MTKKLHTAEIATGLSDFDALAGPIPRQHVTVAAARSSSGATAFALSVARHNDEIGHQAAFASFESGADTIMGNLVAAPTSVNTDRPLSISPGRRARIDRARKAMEQSRLLLWSRAGKPGKWAFAHLMKQLAAQPEHSTSSSWTGTARPPTANPSRGRRSPRCNSSPANATSPSW